MSLPLICHPPLTCHPPPPLTCYPPSDLSPPTDLSPLPPINVSATPSLTCHPPWHVPPSERCTAKYLGLWGEISGFICIFAFRNSSRACKLASGVCFFRMETSVYRLRLSCPGLTLKYRITFTSTCARPWIPCSWRLISKTKGGVFVYFWCWCIILSLQSHESTESRANDNYFEHEKDFRVYFVRFASLVVSNLSNRTVNRYEERFSVVLSVSCRRYLP